MEKRRKISVQNTCCCFAIQQILLEIGIWWKETTASKPILLNGLLKLHETSTTNILLHGIVVLPTNRSVCIDSKSTIRTRKRRFNVNTTTLKAVSCGYWKQNKGSLMKVVNIFRSKIIILVRWKWVVKMKFNFCL